MLCTKIPVPPRNFQDTPQLIVIRSFDVNKPGSEIEELQVSKRFPEPRMGLPEVYTASIFQSIPPF